MHTHSVGWLVVLCVPFLFRLSLKHSSERSAVCKDLQKKGLLVTRRGSESLDLVTLINRCTLLQHIVKTQLWWIGDISSHVEP